MKALRLPGALVGVLALVAFGGAAIGGAAAAPIGIAHAGLSPAPASSACVYGASLVVNPTPAVTGQPIHIVTVLSTPPGAICAGPVAFVYHGLPAGCPAANLPSLVCVPATPGAYPLSVTVYVGTTSTGASSTLTVL
jgi:hypothetical protein